VAIELQLGITWRGVLLVLQEFSSCGMLSEIGDLHI
jgi:hypothetical protein